MLRIGFVGSGLIAWAHGLGLKAMIDGGVIDASIVAVHDERPRRAQAFADGLGAGAAAVVGSAGEVAARCDAVWVCTPTAAHRGAVDEALAAGCALFCEKPLDRDLARAAALVDAVAASGVASQCGLVLRSAPVFRALRDLVESGTLGAPMAAVFRDDQYFPDPRDLRVRLAGRRLPGRRGLPHRALHPRRRHPALLLRRGGHRGGADGEPRRP